MQISNARYIRVSGWYDVTINHPGGWTFDYTVAPHDPAPMAVAIREYVAAHPIEIAPYVPPEHSD
jgi:hypothetical protein